MECDNFIFSIFIFSEKDLDHYIIFNSADFTKV